MENEDLKPGARAFWFNTMAMESRPVTIVKVLKDRYVVETDTGRWGASKSMVSIAPVEL